MESSSQVNKGDAITPDNCIPFMWGQIIAHIVLFVANLIFKGIGVAMLTNIIGAVLMVLEMGIVSYSNMELKQLCHVINIIYFISIIFILY